MPAAVTCPFCTHAFQPPRHLVAGERSVCPRCGETFVVTPDSVDDRGIAMADLSDDPAAGGFRPFVVPAVMGAVFFVVVFTLGLYAIFHKSPDPERDGNAPVPVNTTARERDRLLGLLPPDANVVGVVMPGALPGDFARQLAALGVPADRVTQTLGRVGIVPDQVRGLVGGVVVSRDNPIPRAVVVLSLTRPPVNSRVILEGFEAKLDARGPADGRYKATVGGLPVALRVVDPVTYVVATDEADADRPGTPGVGHFNGSVQESLARWPAGVNSAVATGSDDWAAKPAVAFVAQLTGVPDLAKRLSGVRAGVAWAEEPTGVRGEVLAADTPTIGRLMSALPQGKVDGLWLTFRASPGTKLTSVLPPTP